MCSSAVIRFKGVLEFNTGLDTMIVENTCMFEFKKGTQFPLTISIILSFCI